MKMEDFSSQVNSEIPIGKHIEIFENMRKQFQAKQRLKYEMSLKENGKSGNLISTEIYKLLSNSENPYRK